MHEATDDGQTFSCTLIALLKGVMFRETDEAQWHALLALQSRVQDHVSLMALRLVVDEAEGYAFLQQREPDPQAPLPRLMSRRELSYPVSLLLALLRKKLAESDASQGDARCIISRDQIFDMMRLFFMDSSNEVRVTKELDAHINKAVLLGFLRRLRGQDHMFEISRILKAFVDAQWLGELAQRLDAYRTHAQKEPS